MVNGKLENINFEIKVSGSLGKYRIGGEVNIGPEDVKDAVRNYFLLRDPKKAPPSTLEEDKITISIKYGKCGLF